MHSALDSHSVESRLVFAGGSAEIRTYRWAQATEDIWSADGHFLHFCLSPRPRLPSAAYLDCDGKVAGPVGRVLFVPAGRRVHSGGGEGQQRSLHCMLDTDVVDRLLARPAVWADTVLEAGLCLASADVDHLLMRLQAELHQPGFAAEIVGQSIAIGLGVALVRSFGLDRPSRTAHRGGLAPWRMRRVRDRIASDPATPSLAELAALCGLSVRHLSRAFRAETGTSVADYVARARIERATALLTATDRPIGDIAREAGFGSAASFSHAYRRATGQRPTDVRGGKTSH